MKQGNSSISNFKIFIRRYFLPVVITSTLILGIGGILFEQEIIGNSESSGAFKVNDIINNRHQDRIAIIGSSRALGSYVPRSISPRAFNYGIDGTGMNVHLFFLETLLKEKSNAPIIMNIDMDGFINADGDLGNYLYNYTAVKKAGFLKSDFSFIRNIPFVRYYGYYDVYLKYYLNEKFSITKMTDSGGTFELNQIDSTAFRKAVKERFLRPGVFYSNVLLQQKFERLLKMAANRKIYLIVAPYHKSYNSSFANRKDFDNYFNKIARFPNVRFVDLSGLPMEDSCFFNTTHFTWRGAQEFSCYVRSVILDR